MIFNLYKWRQFAINEITLSLRENIWVGSTDYLVPMPEALVMFSHKPCHSYLLRAAIVVFAIPNTLFWKTTFVRLFKIFCVWYADKPWENNGDEYADWGGPWWVWWVIRYSSRILWRHNPLPYQSALTWIDYIGQLEEDHNFIRHEFLPPKVF